MPLHPAIVHVPLGLALVSPFIYLLLVVMINKNWLPQKAWLLAVFIQALLMGSVLYAEKLGESDEEKVEQVVAEKWIEEHEEKAELFIKVEWVVSLTVVAGLFRWLSFVGKLRYLAVMLSFLTMVSAYLTGHSGGELVYVKGGARAWLEETVPAPEVKTPIADEDTKE